MPRIRDLLYRFRPASPPGGASAGGVPADRAADTAAELQPVFAQLAATEDECRDLHLAAAREAARLHDEAHEEAGRIRREAVEEAASARAQAAAVVSEQGRAETAALYDAATRTAEQLGRSAEELLPQYVDSVIAAAGLP